MSVVAGRRRTARSASPTRTAAAEPARRVATGYLLLLPGHALAGRLLPGADRPAGRHLALRPERLAGHRLRDDVVVLQLLARAVDFQAPFLRSLLYAGIATGLALLLGYPLAYAIAFKAGRWKNLMLVLVIAPFFTSFLVRTLAWKSILSDNGFVVNTLQALHILGPDGRLLATSVAVVTGLTYNFLPFMVLPLYASLEKIDLRLIEAGKDLYANGFTSFRKITLPLSMPGLVAGHPADVHPGRRRLHQRRAARHAAAVHDRQRHRQPVPGAARLPGRRRLLGGADARDRGDGAGLRPPRRHRGAAVNRCSGSGAGSATTS